MGHWTLSLAIKLGDASNKTAVSPLLKVPTPLWLCES